MSEKKRKRHESKAQDLPRKKAAVNGLPKNIKVSVVEDGDPWAPVLASTPGLTLPSTLALKPYTKDRPICSRSFVPGAELMLHSSSHPKLDYTACEESSNGSDNYLKHYVGVYNPETGTLQLVQARKAVVRSTLRSAFASSANRNDEEDNVPTAQALSARSNLGLAFGTKKSQKAIRALTTNAIQPSPSKTKSQAQSDKGRQFDPVTSAVLSSMAESTSSMPTRDEMQAAIDEGKPRPKPNMEASTVAEVYPLEELVGGENVLAGMGVKDWIDTVNAGGDVQIKSRFVARRLRATVESGQVKKVKALRYLLLLIEWFIGLKPGPKSGKKVPKLEDMSSLAEVYGSETVLSVARRFADGIQLNKWHIDNIITHILAIAISLHGFAMDTHDIREDLKLEAKDVRNYFVELGCVISLPTEAERLALKITKAEGSSHRIAKLKLPLVFPKMRVAVTAKRR